ncbi:MAG: putative porin [Methylophilus sp.]|nr:putative porin [Methylophilus sp.]
MMKHLPMKKLSIAVAAIVGLHAGLAQADERESLEQLKATTTNLIDLLVKEGVLPKDKADAIVKKATEDAARQVKQQQALDAIAAKPNDGAAAALPEDKSVRVQYVPEHVKQEMRAEIEQQVMAKLNYKAGERLEMPSWLDRIEFYGDLRMRAQEDNFADGNEIPANLNDVTQDMNVQNATEDRKRLRVRARLGADVKVSDWLVGGLQFVTGLQTTPLTPNQTEGIAQGKYIFGLDRAFLKATPTSWMMVEAGRFANPFLSTDNLFDPDLAFDGLAASFTPKLTDNLTSFTTVGAFPIEEIESSDLNRAKDKWLYSLQTGFKWVAPNKSTVKLAVAYHDYKNVEGQPNSNALNDFGATVPAFRQRGNSTFDINDLNGGTSPAGARTIALASQFEQINIIGQIDFLNFDPVHVTITGDYTKNIGFDKNEILQRTGRIYEEETDAYQVKLDVGTKPFLGGRHEVINKHDWQISLAYKYLESDSVLDGFTDSNFRLGGTDTKGWALVGNYAFDKNAWVGARYLSADTISGLPFSVDVFLVDVNAKF